MNRRTVSFTSASIILVLVMSLHNPAVEVALSSPTTTIFVDPPTSTAAVGQTFVIDIKISDVTDLYGWEFKLSWDPILLNAVSVTEGPFLKQGGGTFFWPKINNTEGYILADCTLLGDVSGVSGSGILANVTFYAEVQGESILDLYDTILVSSLEQPITHTANDGTVTVTDTDTGTDTVPGVPVGGIRIPVNKLELLAPYIGLALTISIVAVVTVVTVVFVKRRKEKQ